MDFTQDGDPPKASFPEDDTPWAGLASLAMYKLVNAWQTTDTKSVPCSQQVYIFLIKCYTHSLIPIK